MTEPEKTLEIFIGRVRAIVDKIACIVFQDAEGRIIEAEVLEEKLQAGNIGIGDRIRCEIKQRGNETVLTLQKIPRKILTGEERERIEVELNRLLPDAILETPTEQMS
jgi:hypothetical protein